MSRGDRVFRLVAFLLLAYGARTLGGIVGQMLYDQGHPPSGPPAVHEDTRGEEIQAALLSGKPFAPVEKP